MAQVTLTGRNVRLRPLTVGDAEATNRWRNSPRAFLLNRGARTVEEQRAWIASRPEGEANFIQELTTGEAVGMISLLDIHPVHLHAEVGHFLIGEPELVKPYGPGRIAAETLSLMYRFIFGTLRLRSHWGPVAADNVQMVLFNKAIGSREIGRLTDHYFLDGHWQDAVIMQMTRTDYRTVTFGKLQGLMGFKEANMLTQDQAEKIVTEAVLAAFVIQGRADIGVTSDTPVYGPTSELDSLGFIATFLAVEDALMAGGINASLAPDDTFDPEVRYANVAAMAQYLTTL